MSARGRERGDLPPPDLSPLGRKAGRGLIISDLESTAMSRQGWGRSYQDGDRGRPSSNGRRKRLALNQPMDKLATAATTTINANLIYGTNLQRHCRNRWAHSARQIEQSHRWCSGHDSPQMRVLQSSWQRQRSY